MPKNKFLKLILGLLAAIAILFLLYSFGAIALMGAAVGAGWAALFSILSFLGGLVVSFLGLFGAGGAAVATFLSTSITSLLAWVSSTFSWLGLGWLWALLAKLYTALLPLISQVGPAMALIKHSRRFYRWAYGLLDKYKKENQAKLEQAKQMDLFDC